MAEGRPSTFAMPSPALGDGPDLLARGRVRLVRLDEVLQRVPDLLRPDRQLRHRSLLSSLLSRRGLPMPRSAQLGACSDCAGGRCLPAVPTDGAVDDLVADCTRIPPRTRGPRRGSGDRRGRAAPRRAPRAVPLLPVVSGTAVLTTATSGPGARRRAGQGLEARLQATSPGVVTGRVTSRTVAAAACPPSSVRSSSPLRSPGAAGRSARRAARAGGDDPAEPEQLVLDVVELPRLRSPPRGRRCPPAARARRPGRATRDQRERTTVGDQVDGPAARSCRRAAPVASLASAGLRRVGQDPAQRHLAVEQRGDGGQLVGELRRVDRRVVDSASSRSAAAASEASRLAPFIESASARRGPRARRGSGRWCGSAGRGPRGTRRRCLPARSVASLPTSWRSG